jgi:hypothetical protein
LNATQASRGKVHARSADDPKTTAHAKHFPATSFTATMIVLLINVLVVLRGYWDGDVRQPREFARDPRPDAVHPVFPLVQCSIYMIYMIRSRQNARQLLPF